MEHFRNEDNNIDFMVSSLGTTFDNANSVSAPPPLHQSRLQNICHAQIDHYRERGNEFSTLLLDFFSLNLCAPFVVLFQVLLI